MEKTTKSSVGVLSQIVNLLTQKPHTNEKRLYDCLMRLLADPRDQSWKNEKSLPTDIPPSAIEIRDLAALLAPRIILDEHFFGLVNECIAWNDTGFADYCF